MPWIPQALQPGGPNASFIEWLNSSESVASGIENEAWFQWMVHYMGGYGMEQYAMPIGVNAAFNPVATPKPAATPQPTSQVTGTTLSAPQNFPSNIDITVVDAVLRAAQATGVPYPLALAIAQQESGFDPNAHHVTSQENSWGVFQLNTMGGEGAGKPQYVLQDPYQNSLVALQHVADYMRAHPGQDWGTIAANAQGADNTGNRYADSVNNYIDQITTGSGSMGWGLNVIKKGDPQFNADVVYGGNSVRPPFSQQFFQNVSQSFGQEGIGGAEQGTDFSMPEGQQISTPVAGIVQTVDDGKRNWGKAVYVKAPNGWTFFVGHLSNFSVQDGETVGPGDLLGQSGGDPNDPSSGVSDGAHIEVRIIDPSGRNQDPMPFLTPIYTGTGITYDQWMGGLFAGSSAPSPVKQSLTMTGDGRFVDLNTTEGAWWKTVDSAWTGIYGVHAPLQAAIDFKSAGITTTDALQNALLNFPSNVPGVTIGQYRNVSNAAQAQANQSFGRSIPEALIQQFFQQGITTADDIKLWFDTHSSSAVPMADYQAIFDAASPYSQALSGDVPHPADVAAIHQSQTQSQDPNQSPYSYSP